MPTTNDLSSAALEELVVLMMATQEAGQHPFDPEKRYTPAHGAHYEELARAIVQFARVCSSEEWAVKALAGALPYYDSLACRRVDPGFRERARATGISVPNPADALERRNRTRGLPVEPYMHRLRAMLRS